MRIIYNSIISLIETLLPLSKLFSPKMEKFANGRRNIYRDLRDKFSPEDKVIWLHAASLGEYEQGLPIITALKEKYPEYKLLITFFSPSGYEVKKNNTIATFTTYLPLDTRHNAKRFLAAINPKLALFVKYEIWPNYLTQLKANHVTTLLISGSFRPKQVYFKPYGGFMRTALGCFDHLFVQNQQSRQLLIDQGFPSQTISISGDTRYDRVSKQLEMTNKLPFAEDFKANQRCLVCGSTWPEDEQLLLPYLNTAPKELKIIIAPHQINAQKINEFRERLKLPSVLYSERAQHNLADYSVLIIDTVGLLSKIYAYADLAYVGGAAGNTGLHNILEPATFGVPVVIGKNHQKFPEAMELYNANGLFIAETPEDCTQLISQLVDQEEFRRKAGVHARAFIQRKTGATDQIIHYIINEVGL